MNHKASCLYRASLYLSLILLFAPTNGLAADSSPLRGPSFTEPSSLIAMPTEWRQRAIQYDDHNTDANLVVTLDQHLYPALLPIIRNFADKNGVKIEVQEGTCGISAGRLSNKQVDIGGFCCPPSQTDRLPGLKFHTLGISALGILVHPDNHVTNLSLKQVRQIFQGKLFRWPELKLTDDQQGPDLPIRPLGRFHCKQRPGHWRLLLDNEDLFSPRLQEVGTIRDMIAEIGASKGSIGYEVLWNIKKHAGEGPVKYITVDRASPTVPDDLITLRYPFYRTYNITTWEAENLKNPLAADLVRHLLAKVNELSKIYNIIPVDRLEKAGWKLKDNELVGEPE
jgi:ABC-type phosphate transport system substrate-binding protein